MANEEKNVKKAEENLYKNKDDPDYNPFEQRVVEHPTNDFEIFLHLVKSILGTGFLAMPAAFKDIGLSLGVIGTVVGGLLSLYTKNQLVRCSHILCFRHKKPSLRYGKLIQLAFAQGPEKLRHFDHLMEVLVDFFIFIYLFGVCCVYMVFLGVHMKEVFDYYDIMNVNKRVCIAMFILPLLPMCLLRNLKWLAPISLVSNILLLIGVGMIMAHCFNNLHGIDEVDHVANIETWPLFFGTCFFSVENAGALMTVENDAKKPGHFAGWISVLTFAYLFIILINLVGGFFGYLKYGEEIDAIITLNLPMGTNFTIVTILLYALGIYLSFPLNFQLSFITLWEGIVDVTGISRHVVLIEIICRILLVFINCTIAILLPTIGPFISLIGAFALTTIGMLFPPLIEIVVYHEVPGYGKLYWVLLRDIVLMILGLLIISFGTYVSILEFSKEMKEDED